MSSVTPLIAQLYGKPVGTLIHVDGDRSLFAFNESYALCEHWGVPDGIQLSRLYGTRAQSTHRRQRLHSGLRAS